MMMTYVGCVQASKYYMYVICVVYICFLYAQMQKPSKQNERIKQGKETT